VSTPVDYVGGVGFDVHGAGDVEDCVGDLDDVVAVCMWPHVVILVMMMMMMVVGVVMMMIMMK
jgi:hypothetical protein